MTNQMFAMNRWTGSEKNPGTNVWSAQLQNMARGKLHPTVAVALRTPKQLKVFHKSKDKKQARVSNLVLAALWRAPQPTHRHSEH